MSAQTQPRATGKLNAAARRARASRAAPPPPARTALAPTEAAEAAAGPRRLGLRDARGRRGGRAAANQGARPGLRSRVVKQRPGAGPGRWGVSDRVESLVETRVSQVMVQSHRKHF